jgi:sortase A
MARSSRPLLPPPREPRTHAPSTPLLLERGLWIVGSVLLGCTLLVYGDMLLFQRSQAARFDQLQETGVAPLSQGGVIGKITIPRIGLSAVVLHGADEDTLNRAVGHIPGTGIPGTSGTVGLAAHRDTFFRNLGRLRPQDLILFETPQTIYEYRVADAAVFAPTNVEVLRPREQPLLVLVTCYPFGFIGPAPKRYVVTARYSPPAS